MKLQSTVKAALLAADAFVSKKQAMVVDAFLQAPPPRPAEQLASDHGFICEGSPSAKASEGPRPTGDHEGLTARQRGRL